MSVKVTKHKANSGDLENRNKPIVPASVPFLQVTSHIFQNGNSIEPHVTIINTSAHTGSKESKMKKMVTKILCILKNLDSSRNDKGSESLYNDESIS